MWNGIVNLTPRGRGRVNFYFGGGVGLAYSTGDAVSATRTFFIDDSSAAYQLMAGFNLPFGRKFEFFTEYRFAGIVNLPVEEVSLGNLGEFGHLRTHNFMFGMRYYLW